MLSAAGIEPPATWDELIAATSALTKDRDRRPADRPQQGIPPELYLEYPFSWQGGADAVDVANKQASFDTGNRRRAEAGATCSRRARPQDLDPRHV